LVLTVKLDQQLAQTLEKSYRCGGVIDEDPMSTGTPELPLDDQLLILEAMPGFVEQRGNRSRRSYLEEGFDHRAVLSGPDQIGLGARADDEEDRVDQDGLAGSRLTRQDVQARRERHDDIFDDGQIADAQLPQHGASRMLRSGAPHPQDVSELDGETDRT